MSTGRLGAAAAVFFGACLILTGYMAVTAGGLFWIASAVGNACFFLVNLPALLRALVPPGGKP